MDPLTHYLSGVLASRAGLRRLCPQAAWIAPLAAMAPDVDAVAGLFGADTYLAWHRQWTHALAAIPLVAALPLLLVRLAYGRRLDLKRGYVTALAAVTLHDLLDLTNAYGVRALLPFSRAWLRLDIFPIVDLWLWALLLAAVLGPMLGRLVSAEIGARSGPGRGAAILALSLLLVYGGARRLLHDRAVAVLEARVYQGEVPLRVAALPHPAQPLRWRGLVEADPFYALCELDLREEFDPAEARILHKARSGPEQAAAERAARATRAFRIFLDFSSCPLWRFTPADAPEGALRVEAMDLRFGEPPAPRFVASALVDAGQRVLHSEFRF
jgi:inner membrane protein